jgi:hypothetical protein
MLLLMVSVALLLLAISPLRVKLLPPMVNVLAPLLNVMPLKVKPEKSLFKLVVEDVPKIKLLVVTGIVSQFAAKFQFAVDGVALQVLLAAKAEGITNTAIKAASNVLAKYMITICPGFSEVWSVVFIGGLSFE